MIGSIGQRALHGCTLRLDDGDLEAASLFPFFDDAGQTRSLMLISHRSPEILLVDFTPELFARRPPWRKRLAVRRSQLHDCTADDAERVADLWHFDPWWELRKERYAGHAAVPLLQATNLPGHDESITRLWLTADLSRVTWIGTGHGEGFKMMRFRPHHLGLAARRRARRQQTPRGGRAQTGWRLRPWWSPQIE